MSASTRARAARTERAAELARTFFRAYIRQVTVKGVYHADPHRGNVLLTPDGRLALLDFGLIGRLDDDTRTSLALLLLAIAHNRADDVADLILSMSLTTMESDEAGFVHDLRRKLPRYQWRSLEGIRTGEALADLQRLCLQHGIALPTSFALVGKTLAQAESIARTLDPTLDPVEMLRSEGWTVMAQEAERRLEPNQLLAFGFTQLQPLLRMPRRLASAAQRLEAGSLKVGIVPTDLEGLEALARSTANRVGAAMIISALLISSALMARVNHTLCARRLPRRGRARPRRCSGGSFARPAGSRTATELRSAPACARVALRLRAPSPRARVRSRAPSRSSGAR